MVEVLYPDNIFPDKVGLCLFGMPCVVFNKSRQLDELFVTKNSVYTKHDIERQAQRPLTYNNMLALHTDDPIYKKKRKALSAAFFKSKMSLIAKIVKQTTLHCFSELQAKGPSNEVDLSSFTSMIQAHIIVSIMVGVGHSHKLLPYHDLTTGEETMKTAGSCMDRIIPDLMTRLMSNPIF